MVGDTLKKAGDSSAGSLFEIKDFTDTQYALFLVIYFTLKHINWLFIRVIVY